MKKSERKAIRALCQQVAEHERAAGWQGTFQGYRRTWRGARKEVRGWTASDIPAGTIVADNKGNAWLSQGYATATPLQKI